MNTNTTEQPIIKTAVKLRIRPPKRRTPSQRLKARLYYRTHRSNIRVQRRRYIRTHGSVLKHRKMFMRFKPTWFKKIRKTKHPHPPKPKKFKLIVPKHVKTKKHVSIPH